MCVCVCFAGASPGAAVDHWRRMAGPVWRALWGSKDFTVTQRSASQDLNQAAGDLQGDI